MKLHKSEYCSYKQMVKNCKDWNDHVKAESVETTQCKDCGTVVVANGVTLSDSHECLYPKEGDLSPDGKASEACPHKTVLYSKDELKRITFFCDDCGEDLPGYPKTMLVEKEQGEARIYDILHPYFGEAGVEGLNAKGQTLQLQIEAVVTEQRRRTLEEVGKKIADNGGCPCCLADLPPHRNCVMR